MWVWRKLKITFGIQKNQVAIKRSRIAKTKGKNTIKMENLVQYDTRGEWEMSVCNHNLDLIQL